MRHDEIARALRSGASDRAIARRLRVDATTVAQVRASLGLPKVRSGVRPASLEDLFWQRTDVTPEGHLVWTGYRASGGAPALRHGGTTLTAYRIAWGMSHERAPVGQLRPGCGVKHCVHPDHLEDQTIRTAYRALVGRPIR
ncbi:hypothetical protein [Streptomyces cacaoi]|uniref:hypothetical protein n=1 Tax=Streptomyces cacaoi TaxID=1898 RepID=UPI002625B64C|nr:hypothetical protein [Streptomyces cacaoi]